MFESARDPGSPYNLFATRIAPMAEAVSGIRREQLIADVMSNSVHAAAERLCNSKKPLVLSSDAARRIKADAGTIPTGTVFL